MKVMKNVVYLITNKLNNKSYVGVAKNLKNRIYQHANGHDKEQSYIDKSIVKYGWENFEYKVIDHYETEEERKSLEQRYIKEYKTHRSEGGYNLTWGGDANCFPDSSGENNPRAQFTEEDVKNIRIRRMNGERLADVYEDYKDKVEGDKRAGFSKLWLHESWVEICKEFKGKYPPVDSKNFAAIRRNNLKDLDLNLLTKYFKWNGPISKYNIIYKNFKDRCDWQTFQEVCKKIVEDLYGNKNSRKYKKKNGEIDRKIEEFRKELLIEPTL